jgi:ribosomal protein L21E
LKQLKAGTRVRLTNERILQLDSNSAKRFRGRVGTVIGYRPGAKGPLVEFDADEERRSEILQDVAPGYFDVLPA